MLRLSLALLATFTTAAALAQSVGEFELGTHYNRLTPAQPTSSGPQQIEVAEVFWYGCPHCYNFDPYLNAWEANNADYVNFIRIPAVWNPLVRLHAQAFYTAQVLGKGAEMHEAFFAEIHRNTNYLDTPEKLAAFFATFGVSRDEFTNTFNSPEVNERLQKAEELNERYRITSVPSIVINGKFTSNASMTGSYERLIELIDELAAGERGVE
ncbi:MAG: thiol:disulfide interchange protein DsbA/DsbL [Gammaproteobacteria bacterium]|jgi:thiol:disulfide interchange protein DsbA